MLHHARTALPWTLAACLLASAGCNSADNGSPSLLAPAPRTPATQLAVTLDGSIDEWPADKAVLADAHYLYLRLAVEGTTRAIQASHESLTILLDVDADAATGTRIDEPANSLGVDLEVRFSPRRDDGSPGRGVSVVAHTPDGPRTLSHADLDLLVAPTHAAEWYELRLSRILPDGLPRAGLASDGRASGMIVLHDAGGQVAGWSDPFTVALAPAAREPHLGDADLPRKPRGAVRIVSWNVEHAAPMRNAGPFANAILALEPDVVLVQEWTLETPGQLRGWFTASLPASDGRPWHTHLGDGWGVAIVSKHPLEPLGPTRLELPGHEAPVRFIGAIAHTPSGPVALASIHLKCCGGADGPEDAQRNAEARLINATLADALTGVQHGALVIAGDVNLVGRRKPLDTLAAGLASGGGNLAIAAPRVLGDAAYYTWSDPGTEFSPGRLDFALVGGGRIVNAFVLDTARLSDAALERIGLDRTDTAASDHRPLVIDVMPR
ncbi:MAG TPA: endonuclease/exonuclease/phosphatase family protein [Phycisphaerales bacterium]|nr:endonuclease/exonuclease/phosphatase family protein [Phycisphaerales bacterium]